MDANAFRRLALDLPGAVEGEHMRHPDFRVGGKIFATLWTDGETGVVMLTPDQQARFADSDPDAFQPVKGAWGRKGCTRVCLPAATKSRVEKALAAAWRNTAEKGSTGGRKKKR